MVKLSFVVPLFNKEAYISDCLDSLTHQTFKDIEIIVVDDKSTDDSLEIAQFMATKDKRIKVFPLPKNQGRSSARNYGNDMAQSKIIAVQDADDVAMPTRAEEIVKAFKKDIDVFYSSFHIDNQNVIEARPLDKEKIKETLFNYIGHSTMAYKLSACPGYSSGKWADLGLDDWKLQIDMIKAKRKFFACPKPLLFYRNVKSSISNTRDESKVIELKTKYLSEVTW